MKPKIMIISDTPKISSGMGVAHLELAAHLHSSNKYEVASFGWFWGSALARGLTWNLPWAQFNCNDYSRPYGHPLRWPDSNPEDFKASPVYQAIEKFKPDVVIGIGDVWMLDFIHKMPNRKSFKFIWEFPIDGEPVPTPWVDIIKDADIPVVMSQYAASVIRDINPLVNVRVIPRGIDMRVFKPIKPLVGKDLLRKEHLPQAEGKFVVGMFDRFQDRKQINRGMEAFKKFINKDRPDAMLYLHMDVNDPASADQGKTILGESGLIKRYGLEDRVIYNEKLRVETGVDIDKLVNLYNCCDVKISSTQGEGWGLTNVEAMACGVPVIATNYTTLPEIIGNGRGLLADVKALVTGMYNVQRALVDTDHMAALIDSLYCSQQLRYQIVTNAIKWVQRLDWPYIMPQWEEMIDQCCHKPKYKLLGPDKDYKIERGVPEVTVSGAVLEDTGWAITTRGLATGLAENGAIVKIKEDGGKVPGYKTTKEIHEMMVAPESHMIEIINHMPEITAKKLQESKAKYKVAFFPFELPKLHKDVVGSINRFADVFMTPSKFCRDLAIKAGVRNAVYVPIHSDVDLNAEPYTLRTDRTYKILCLGNLGDIRKNAKTLVRAYLKTFTSKDDVCLVLKSIPGHKDSDPSEFVEELKKMFDDPAEILIIHEAINPSSIYKSVDCLVQPTRTEGFCAPVYEAMNFGLHIIATGYGGHMDYITEYKNSQILPFKLEPATKSPVYKAGDVWAEPDFKSLCFAMRKAYDERISKGEPIPSRSWKDVGAQILEHAKDNPKKIKILFENQEKNLWNDDNNINLKRYAPPKYRFVTENPDIQIVNITRLSDAKKIRCSKYIVLFHCRGEWSEENIKDYLPIFEGAMFVYSHQDLKKELPNSTFKFRLGPWGTDDSKFFEVGLVRDFKIMNTGMVASTEGIEECLKACDEVNGKQVHVGRNFGFKSANYINAYGVTEEAMTNLYSRSEFVSGLRRIEGFEKPVIEGLLCGARPICFDRPIYRYWYEGIAEFVPEGDFDTVKNALVEIFKKGPRPVTDAEKSMAIKRFGWKNVACDFWDFL